MYVYICMYIATINGKESMNLKDSKKVQFGKVWREEAEGRNAVIILESQK